MPAMLIFVVSTEPPFVARRGQSLGRGEGFKAIHGNRLEVYFSRAEHEIGDEEMERTLTARDQSEEIETERRW